MNSNALVCAKGIIVLAMKIRSKHMSEFLSGINARKYYTFCRDAALAGSDRSLREVTFFAKDETHLDESFVCLKKYSDCFARIIALTSSEELISESIGYLISMEDICEYELSADDRSILTMPCLTDFFEVSTSNEELNPSYSIGSLSELRLTAPGASDIFRFDPSDSEVKVLLEAELSELSRSDDEVGSWSLENKSCVGTRIYLLRQNGQLAAYLRAECAFANYYEIKWLHTLKKMRGQRLAKKIVSYFLNDCIKNDLFPVYGSAVCRASERVAVGCGFSKDTELKYRRMLTKMRQQ